MKKTKTSIFTMMAMLVVLGTISITTVFAAAVVTQESDVEIRATNVVVGSATLKRTDNGISAVLKTTGLNDNHKYTMWWDIRDYDGSGDISTRVVMIATGGSANADGDGTFAASLKVGLIPPDNNITVRVNVTNGGDSIFANTQGATVKLLVRDHGPTQPGLVREQTSTHGGGCNNDPTGGVAGNYACATPQGTVGFH